MITHGFVEVRWFGYVGYLIGICANASMLFVTQEQGSSEFDLVTARIVHGTGRRFLLHLIRPCFFYALSYFILPPPTGFARRGG